MKPPKTLTHVVNPKDNSGEYLTIYTTFNSSGKPKNDIYITQKIKLMSYNNSATFELFGTILTPSFLRGLANDIEAEFEHLNKK